MSWFRDGFREQFSFAEKIIGEWVSPEEVRLTPSPLESPVRVAIPQVIVDGDEFREREAMDNSVMKKRAVGLLLS